MTLETKLPQICSCQQLRFSNKPKSYQPTTIYHQLKYNANDDKLPTTVSESEENFSLAGLASTKCEIGVHQQELASSNSAFSKSSGSSFSGSCNSLVGAFLNDAIGSSGPTSPCTSSCSSN
jgi:hypothetical protein